MATDLESVRKIRDGDAAGMNELISRYRLAVYNYLLLVHPRDYRIVERFQELFLSILEAVKRRVVRADIATWIYRHTLAVSDGFQIYVNDEAPLVQKRLAELSLPLRQVIFFRQQLDLPWDQVARILKLTPQQLKADFREVLFRIVPVIREGRALTAICSEIDRVLVEFVYGEMDPVIRVNYQRHAATCVYCHSRIRAIQNYFIDMEAVVLEEPPAIAIQSIMSVTTERLGGERRSSRRSMYLGGVALAAIGVIAFAAYRNTRKPVVLPKVTAPKVAILDTASPPRKLEAPEFKVEKPALGGVVKAKAPETEVMNQKNNISKKLLQGNALVRIPNNKPALLRSQTKDEDVPVSPDVNCDPPENVEMPGRSEPTVRAVESASSSQEEASSLGREGGGNPLSDSQGTVPIPLNSAQSNQPQENAVQPGFPFREAFRNPTDKYWVAVGKSGDIVEPAGSMLQVAVAGQDSSENSPPSPRELVAISDVVFDEGGRRDEGTDRFEAGAGPMSFLPDMTEDLEIKEKPWYPRAHHEDSNLPRQPRDNACRLPSR